ncbi:MAG: glycosyltransferase family 2 protein, partial [Gammaproteobacteria bacterium]|nr:glycosyltransferase family 2 protein [Gammaproteobacteria bacterium]
GSGRARQMNAGAEQARGDVLLFLHADTRLPENADMLIREALEAGRVWGRFDVRLSGQAWLLRVIETLMNWRSCLTGIATGDQAMFVLHDAFVHLGGFADIPLMEDIELSHRLKKISAPCCLHSRVITSSRRWETRGILRTVLLMWGLRLAWFFGVSATRLQRIYYR